MLTPFEKIQRRNIDLSDDGLVFFFSLAFLSQG